MLIVESPAPAGSRQAGEVYMFKRYFLTLTETILGIVEFLLTIRILLKFFGASTVAPFVKWVYETTNPLLAPFEGMFPTSTISTGFVLEVSTLFALITYAFVGVLLESIIHHLAPLAYSKDQEEAVVTKRHR